MHWPVSLKAMMPCGCTRLVRKEGVCVDARSTLEESNYPSHYEVQAMINYGDN